MTSTTDHTPHTSLAAGQSWVPRTGPADGFIERFSRVAESFYGRDLDEDARRQWKSDQLGRVLHKVSTGSPFYRRHLEGVDIGEVGLDSLHLLPFTTKEHLRREMYDVLSGPISEATFFYETTGTTGRATPCPRDAKEIVSSNAHLTESWNAIFRRHFGDHKPVIALMGPTEVHSFGDTLGDVARNTGSCNAKIWPYSPVVGFRKALELMRDLEIEVAVATPGVCLNLARAARLYGFDIEKDFSLRLFFTTGEMCTSALARNIESVWGVKAYNILYGSQEAFVMGVACPSGAMRLTDLNYVVEVIDPVTSESLGERGSGELCVTTLADGIKPLVRYRTGDLVTISDDAAHPGDLPGPVLQVVGRVLDQVELGGTRHRASAIETAVLEDVQDCYGYQVVIDRDALGADAVTVRMELRDPAAEHVGGQCDGIVTRFRDRLGVAARVEILDALDDVVSTGAFVSWKAARVLDRRIAPGHEEIVAQQLAGRRSIGS